MMTADAKWLTGIALVYLVLINASANGCRLALCDLAATSPWPANLARCIADAAVATATTAAKNPRSARRRSARRRVAAPQLTAVPATA